VPSPGCAPPSERTCWSAAPTRSPWTCGRLIVAATFAVLATLPLVPLAQLGLGVAAGILLDTFVVRLFLVPALLLRPWRRAAAKVPAEPATAYPTKV
jgi:uncharacterized membrane protein YdfJ with MMPL/SSD domain